MSDLDRIKERIRKLLNVAEDDAASEGEIDNALRFATHMMASHNLSRDDIVETDAGELDVTQVVYGRRECFCVGRRLSYWESELCRFICQLVGTCKWYYATGRVRRTSARIIQRDDNGEPILCTAVYFYGPDDDVEFCKQLFEEMDVAIASMARMRHGSFFCGKGGSYCEGFITGLIDSHRKETKRIEADSENRSLMVLSNERAIAIKQEANNWLKESGVKLSSGSGRGGVSSGFSNSAFNQGKRDGKNYDLPAKNEPLQRIGKPR